jgi:hypothetical protein
MRYGSTLVHRLSSFNRSQAAAGLAIGLLSWTWCGQFLLEWGSGPATGLAMLLAVILAASTLMMRRVKAGASPIAWLAIAGWTVVCPFALAFTTSPAASVLDDRIRAFFAILTSALLFLVPGLALLLWALPRSGDVGGRQTRSAIVAAGAVWCLAPLTVGAWPGPHAVGLVVAAVLLIRFVQEVTAETVPAPANKAGSTPTPSPASLLVALLLAIGAGIAVTVVQWLTPQLFLPTAALWSAVWGGFLIGLGSALKSRQSQDRLAHAARHCAMLALLIGGLAAGFPLLLRAAMAISGSVSWLPAIVGLRTLVIACMTFVPGRVLGASLAMSAGKSPLRRLVMGTGFTAACAAASWFDLTLLSALPVVVACCLAAVGLWLMSARSSDLHSRLQWTPLAATALAMVCACIAAPDRGLPAQRMLFSGTHFDARALGVPNDLLPSIDDGRPVRSTVTSQGVTTVWNHMGVQWILRENGLKRGVVSTQPDLCPQSVPEVLTAVLPLTMHSEPHHILVTSASYPTVAATCLAFPVESVTAIEDNPAAIQFCREAAERICPSLSKGDNRLALHEADPVRGLATSDRAYDVIISPDSIIGDLSSCRQWTVEHLKSVARHLTPEGVFCQRVTCFDLNVASVLDLVHTAQTVFPFVQLNEVAPGEWLLVARPTAEIALDKTFLERLERTHVRDVLAQAGWDWSITISLKTVHPADLQKAAAGGSLLSMTGGTVAYSLPLDVMRWGPKFERRRQWMASIGRPFGDALGDEPALADVARRLSDVTLAQQIMIDHPDQFAAYRHFVKKRLQDRPRPKVIQVAGEGLKNGLDPEDSRRKEYLRALGKAVESKQRNDIDRLTAYFSPFDPLIVPFIPREYVNVDRQSESPNAAAQWRCGLRSVFYSPPNDASVNNVCDALEVLQNKPDVVGDAVAQWDCCNALLEVLKNRWGLRITAGASLKYGVADAHRTLELAGSSLERMDHLRESAGISETEWRTRRTVLEKHLIRPVRSWRTEQSAQFALQAAKELRPPVEPVEAVEETP